MAQRDARPQHHYDAQGGYRGDTSVRRDRCRSHSTEPTANSNNAPWGGCTEAEYARDPPLVQSPENRPQPPEGVTATKVAFIPPRRIQWYNTTGGSHRASSGNSPPSPFTGYQIDPRTGALVPPPRDGQWEGDRDIHLNKFAIKIFILHRRGDRLDLNQGQDRALARVLEAISAPMIPREDGSPKLLPMCCLLYTSEAADEP